MTKEEFIGTPENWDSHRYLLWEALELTKGKVIELGVGYGSTGQLHEYCLNRGRALLSYESNIVWLNKLLKWQEGNHVIKHVTNWDDVDLTCDVLFVDHAPGERRKVDIARAANIAKILVCHDTEPSADHGYQMRNELLNFKYKKEHVTSGAWTTMVSNFIEF